MEEFDELILKLGKRFENSLKENNDELTSKFIEYLYKTLENLNTNNIENEKEFIKYRLEKRAEYIITIKDDNAKKSILLHDNNFEELKQLSENIFRIAIKKAQNEKYDELNLTAEIEKMKNLKDNVESYNQEQAKKLISEAVLDSEFIENPNTEYISLRLSHIINNLQNKEER